VSGETSVQLKSIGPRRYAKLVDLINRFDREAQRCAKARAYYAACVLQGAVLEGLLTAVCDGYVNEVSAYLSALPERQRPKGQPVNWTLDQLIKVAVSLNWLPIRRGQKGPRKIGDWLNLVKELRNLVHPGKHLRDYPDIYLRKAHFTDSFSIVRAATDHLWQEVTRNPPGKIPTQKPVKNTPE
jgi:hypothetical protein